MGAAMSAAPDEMGHEVRPERAALNAWVAELREQVAHLRVEVAALQRANEVLIRRLDDQMGVRRRLG